MNLKIKVCGMRDPENIRQVEALGIDMMGFIFHPGSPRFVSAPPSYLPRHCMRVGVFVNSPLEDVLSRVSEFALNAVQLHGKESPEYCRELKREVDGLILIKALQARDAAALEQSRVYDEVADLLLFDSPCPTYGGSGVAFDWSLLDSYLGRTPFMLSGGIGVDSAPAVSALSHPLFIGVDLNSRFETAPAMKDPASLSYFIKQIKNNKAS